MFKFTENEVHNQVTQKRENFRQEIRKQDVEGLFNQKRLTFKQQEVGIQLELSQLMPAIRVANGNQDQGLLRQLHQLAFKYSCDENEIKRRENLEYLINNQYIQEAIVTLRNPGCDSKSEIFRALANTCQHEAFYKSNEECIKTSLAIAFQIIKQCVHQRELSDVLVFVGNVASQSVKVCEEFVNQNLLQSLLVISNTQDVNLLRNLCFCLHVVTKLLDDNKRLLKEQRLIGLQIIINVMKINDSDMIHCEILHPLTVLYQTSQEMDQLIINEPTKFIVSTIKGEFQDVTLQVIKQLTLSDSLQLANQLIDLDVLDIVMQNCVHKKQQSRKQAYLILTNLSYNDNNISNRIINHKVINRIINGLITQQFQEKEYCMSVILNLMATGNNVVFKKLIDLGLLQIVSNLLEIEQVTLLRKLLDCLLRFLNYGREIQDDQQQEQNSISHLLQMQNIGAKLDKLTEQKDDQIQDKLEQIQLFL